MLCSSLLHLDVWPSLCKVCMYRIWLSSAEGESPLCACTQYPFTVSTYKHDFLTSNPVWKVIVGQYAASCASCVQQFWSEKHFRISDPGTFNGAEGVNVYVKYLRLVDWNFFCQTQITAQSIAFFYGLTNRIFGEKSVFCIFLNCFEF